MVNIHERRRSGIPVIIEGETGVGKTALLEMLSILWNTAYNDIYRRTTRALSKMAAHLIQGMLTNVFFLTKFVFHECLPCRLNKMKLTKLILCEATARSTKLRKMQFYKSVFYQKNEALLLITTLLCLKVFASPIMKTNPKVRGPLKSLPKIVSKRSHQKECVQSAKNRKVCSALRCISSSPGR